MKVIELKDVWEQYRIKFVREKRVFWEHIWALQAVNLEIERGECVGIIGENGAGKTTLLKVIAGMLCPDKGESNVEGRVSCLMELGTGFHPELTGRENVFLNAGLYGLSKEEIEKKFDQIVEFAGIGKFIDAIVKSYSQGMYMRLAFSLAIHVDPDILLIDDILAIGDEDAQRKCINKIFELKEKGTTILFVTHGMDLVAQLCQRAVFLKEGRLIKDGSVEEVVKDYLDMVKNKEMAFVGQLKSSDKNFSIEKDDLKVICDPEQNRIRLYYKDKEITQDNGLYTALCSNNHWYHPFDASWQIERQNHQKFLLTLKYPQISLTQLWQIELTKDNIIDLNVDIEVAKETILSNRDIRLEVNNRYINWATPYEEGNFEDGEYIDDIKPVRLKNSKVTRVGLKPNQNEQLPSLIFDFSLDNLKIIASLYKRIDSETEKINLQFSQIIPNKDQNLLLGRYRYFKGQLIINKELELTKETLNISNKIWIDKLKVIFDEGRSRIFYKDKELTTGLGMYTTLRSSGIWYDSYQAAWSIQEMNDTKITIIGDWPHIPVSQFWQIEILDEWVISWKIKMEVYNQFNKLELVQVNLMLNSLYKKWVALDKSEGIFLDDFTQDYDILPYRFWYGPANGNLKALSSDSPPVSFFSTDKENNFRAIIGNTDSVYKARLLQYQKVNLREFANYIYFAGIIKIG